MATRGDIGHRVARADSRPDPYLPTARAILTDLFGPPPERAFAVRFWEGSLDLPSWPDSPSAVGEPSFTLVLRSPGALRQMLLPPTTRSLGRAYVHDHIDIEGDIEAAAVAADRLFRALRSPRTIRRLLRRVWSLPPADSSTSSSTSLTAEQEASGATAESPRRDSGRRVRRRGTRHSPARDREAVRYHYDLGNDFYALWLDRHMQYSSAWFDKEERTLDAAQEARLDLICRKLHLRPGERLLDIGCGWGGLIRFAARAYGVSATGITLSERQAEWASDHIAREGLEGSCRVEIRDYRDFPSGTRFDKAVSVGMIEHVGASRLPEYFRDVLRLLTPGGLFLSSGIVLLEPASGFFATAARKWGRRWTSFIDSYVFPDGELVTPAETVGPAEAAGFELRSLETLREHYALTLRCWVDRLEARRREAVELVGEQAYRIWRLYMGGSAHAFAAGRIGVIQTLFARPDETGAVRLPLGGRV